MARHSKTRGRTHVTMRQGVDRTIRHVDPTDPQHRLDHERYSEAYRAARERARERLDLRPARALKFPSLEGGFMLGADGRELTSRDHYALLKSESERRGWYSQETLQSNGQPRLRKCHTDALHLLAISVRPDFSQALAFLSSHPKDHDLVKPFLKQAMMAVAEDFEVTTGLEVIAEECHPEEGNLHFHLAYSSVSADHRLLWTRQGIGRKGLRLLGPSHTGTIRLAQAGYLRERDASLARKDLVERISQNLGAEPLDLHLSHTLDALCDRLFAGPLAKVFEWAAGEYKQALETRRADRPAELKAAKETAIAERDQLAAENKSLRAQIGQLKGQLFGALPAPVSPRETTLDLPR